MKRFPLLVLLVFACGLLAPEASAQGFGPTAAEEAKVLSVLSLGPGRVAGEIGAGDGQLAIRVARAVSPGGRVFASELGQAKQETLKGNADRAGATNLQVVDAQNTTTGFPADCCDAIFMRDVYHHLTAPDAILADIRRALRPMGLLLIIDFEPRNDLPSVEGVRENRGGHGLPIKVLVGELKTAGFEIVSEDPTWRSDLWAVVARRPRTPTAPTTGR